MADAPARAWLGLGSNLGDRAGAIAAATRRVERLSATRVTARSSLYETAPWGFTDQPAFLNAALAVETGLTPEALLDACLGIERELGRSRAQRWGPRLIDLDILHVEGVSLDIPGLTLPHPRLTERAFALAPLAEIAPELEVAGRTVAFWLDRLDATGVRRRD